MPPEDQPGLFVSRTLTGPAQEGANLIPWDGKDGAGLDLPPGFILAQVGVALQTAEVHFPYIDMEINSNGIIIQLLSEDFSSVEQDVVFWNDTGIPTGGVSGSVSNPINASHANPPTVDGISSGTNGHRWGQSTSATAGTFGDVKSMDTWIFVDSGPFQLTNEYDFGNDYDDWDEEENSPYFQWSTSNPGIATIDQNGLLTPVTPGNVTITFFVRSPKGECEGFVTLTLAIRDADCNAVTPSTLITNPMIRQRVTGGD